MLSFSTLLSLIWAWADEIFIPEAAGGYEQFWLELNIQQTREHQLHSINEGKDLTSIFENRNQIAQRFKICIVFFSSWILLESISVKH